MSPRCCSAERATANVPDFSIEVSHEISKDDVRQQLPHLRPPLRLVAEDWLAASTVIDFVTLDPAGDIALILIGEAGDDAALLTRAIAHRSWVAARLGNWRQLAPELGIAADGQVRAVLLCPSFAPETLAAAEALEGAVQLVLCCSIGSGDERRLLFEALSEPLPGRASSTPATAVVSRAAPRGRQLRVDVAPFRSGLTEEDLNLTAEEIGEFT